MTGLWNINGWNLLSSGLFTLYCYYNIVFINWTRLEPRLNSKKKKKKLFSLVFNRKKLIQTSVWILPDAVLEIFQCEILQTSRPTIEYFGI